jgi:adenine nucleotide transporter 17
MAKVRIQARSADDEEALEEHHSLLQPHKPHHDAHFKHVGALQILARVWRKEGFVGWYRVCSPEFRSRNPRSLVLLLSQGMSAQIIKAVLSQALLFMSKDQFETYALIIMAFFAKLSKS